MEAFPMKSGHDPQSYSSNSSFQKEGINAAMAILEEALADNMIGLGQLSAWHPFCMADMGCSIGPNTFLVAQSILDLVEATYKRHGLEVPEFLMFFNDHDSNDFNTLFSSLPPDRHYFASGVPGSFYGRLFPRATLHVVHTSYTLHWLSQVPKEVMDRKSPAWNKGMIYFAGASEKVVEAYAAQYGKDLDCFLHARAEELVSGGLMAMVVLCRSGVSTDPEGSRLGRVFTLLGSALMDMAALGKVDGAMADAFNLPIYMPSIEEFEGLVRRNGCYRVEHIQPLIPDQAKFGRSFNVPLLSKHIRAVVEGVVTAHFGNGVLDELFDRFRVKVEENVHLFTSNPKQVGELFALLRREPIS